MSLVIVDIDGTIADCTHRLHYIKNHPKNWDAYFSDQAILEDKEIGVISELLMALWQDGYSLLYLTGRPEKTRAATEKWLWDICDLPVADVIMRPESNFTNDDDLKPMMLTNYLTNTGQKLTDIAFCLEDRSRIVRAFRQMGLTVLQVADGDF